MIPTNNPVKTENIQRKQQLAQHSPQQTRQHNTTTRTCIATNQITLAHIYAVYFTIYLRIDKGFLATTVEGQHLTHRQKLSRLATRLSYLTRAMLWVVRNLLHKSCVIRKSKNSVFLIHTAYKSLKYTIFTKFYCCMKSVLYDVGKKMVDRE